jgi:hypothetical protein
MQTKIDPNNKIYLRALKREGNFWEGTPYTENKRITNIDRYKNFIISGDETKDISNFLKNINNFKKGLSIGCGSANTEIDLLKKGIV